MRLSEEANLFLLGWGKRQRRLQATITGNTSHVAVGIASDKKLIKALLQQAGLPVPEGETVGTLEQAQAAARRLGAPMTIKPLDANHGKGVTTTCVTPEDVAQGFEHALDLLRRQGVDADSVLPAGSSVPLRANANLSIGGTAEDVTDLLPQETVRICVRAARAIGLDIAGIDIVCEAIARPLPATPLPKRCSCRAMDAFH